MESGKWRVGILFLFVLLSACTSGEGIESHEAWVRNALQGETSAVYLILHNHTSEDDALISVSTDVADAVELHLTQVQNDVMTMTRQDRIEILAGDEVAFETGSYHIMLIGLKKDLNVGDEISLTLHFEHYLDVIVNVPVQDSAETLEHSHP